MCSENGRDISFSFYVLLTLLLHRVRAALPAAAWSARACVCIRAHPWRVGAFVAWDVAFVAWDVAYAFGPVYLRVHPCVHVLCARVCASVRACWVGAWVRGCVGACIRRWRQQHLALAFHCFACSCVRFTNTCTHARTYANMHACMHAHTHARAHARTHTHMHAHTWILLCCAAPHRCVATRRTCHAASRCAAPRRA